MHQSMNINDLPVESKKKSMFGFVISGMQKMGLDKFFGNSDESEAQVFNLRKNSKSERVIFKFEEFSYDSDNSSNGVQSETEEKPDFSKEIEV